MAPLLARALSAVALCAGAPRASGFLLRPLAAGSRWALSQEAPESLGPNASAAAPAEGTPTFEEFVRIHGRSYAPGSSEWQLRRRLFERAVAEVELQNSKPGRSWTARINRLADRTEEELTALRGYRRDVRPPSSSAASGAPSTLFVGLEDRDADLARLPQAFSWKGKLHATSKVLDQGKCGSCWAVSSAVVLRAHTELFQEDRQFSVEEILSCTPNPNECGGQGGCKGATAELAMDYVATHGCKTSAEWEYDGKDNPRRCPAEAATAAAAAAAAPAPQAIGALAGAAAGALAHAAGLVHMGGESFGMRGYRRLPENQLAPVMLALVERGPVVVSLAAGPSWNMYYQGIMDSCEPDAIIDHAVVLVGYGIGKGGNDQDRKYWHIQNSWGPHWGEGGFIRLERHDAQKERQHCGTDRMPEVGSGCKGGPPKVRVCGSCGLLYDVVVPDFDLAPQGLWSSEEFVQQLQEVPVADDDVTVPVWK